MGKTYIPVGDGAKKESPDPGGSFAEKGYRYNFSGTSDCGVKGCPCNFGSQNDRKLKREI
jgi:hypothetical protein